MRVLARILSLGLVVLGVGCVAWALANIHAESDLSTDGYPVPAAVTTPLAQRLTGSTREATTRIVLQAPPPKPGEKLGTLTIPALKQTLPIVEGTSDRELKKGVGHFIQSVMPGQDDNCVLAGHRDTVFSGLGTLTKGDLLIVRTAAGTFTYAITRTRIVHKADRTVIVPSDHAILTLSTCYPFHYVGFAPDRYIIVADLVASE
jgi:sortase A